jgi:SPP1 gp7 family putative phage head morphogenesis protein
MTLAINKDGIKGLLKTVETAFKRLHKNGKYAPEDLAKTKAYKDLISQTSTIFNGAIADNDIPEAMVKSLKEDTFIFSGLKTNAQLAEASQLLLTDDGKVKSFSAFSKDVESIKANYNENYLEAEYQFAVSSSQSAGNWANISNDYDLQYRTAGDDRVRDSHDKLRDVTLPTDDAFWLSYYPPNGWRCRCTAVQVRKGKYEVSDSTKAIAEGEKATKQIGKDGKNKLEIFRFNPGIQKVVFPPTHPYTKVAGAQKVRKELKKGQIEEKLNITKGAEMTFEEANELKGNINYSKGGGYFINCQSCVVSNELRRRGYDVTALENTRKKENIPSQLSRKTNWAWLNEKGEMPEKTKAGGAIGFDNRNRIKSKTIIQLTKELNDITQETGRYHIDFAWKRGNSGHIITIERLEKGTVRLYDPQNGKIVKWSELSKNIKVSYGVNVLRVDNLQINTSIVDGIVKKLD